MVEPEPRIDTESDDERATAMRQLTIVWATILVCVFTTYLVPQWSELRPFIWGTPREVPEGAPHRPHRHGDNWLVVRHYFDTDDTDQAIATGGARTTEARRDVASLETQLGHGVATTLATAQEPVHQGPRARIDADEYAGIE